MMTEAQCPHCGTITGVTLEQTRPLAIHLKCPSCKITSIYTFTAGAR